MKTIKGTPTGGGCTVGRIYHVPPQPQGSAAGSMAAGELDWQSETARYLAAYEQACKELELLSQNAQTQFGDETAEIFEAQSLILQDESFTDEVCKEIRSQGLSAERAVHSVSKHLSELFASMSGDYMQARSADVQDIALRLQRFLGRNAPPSEALPSGCIWLAENLLPSDLMALQSAHPAGFIMKSGSPYSHTAILIKAMGLPAIFQIGAAMPDIEDGMTAVLDGNSGVLILDPDEAAMAEYQAQCALSSQAAEAVRGLPAETKDGRRLHLFANVGTLADIKSAVDHDADGIGLFRSEFLFLGHDWPSEQAQYEAYCTAAKAMMGKPVIIRTMDIGTDKQARYMGLPKEANPDMGMRGIRYCLKNPVIFSTQLRAICRASAFGNVSIMLPLVISPTELIAAKNLLHEVMAQLSHEQIPFDQHIPLGVMIETPAAALRSAELAEAADFFSIGTNDLAQFLNAIDRRNDQLSDYVQVPDPALMQLIRCTVQNAHQRGIPVGICGELGADPRFTKDFIAAGIDELSVSPHRILSLRAEIRSL